MNPTIRLTLKDNKHQIPQQSAPVFQTRKDESKIFDTKHTTTYVCYKVRASASPAKKVAVCCICKIHFIRKEPGFANILSTLGI